MLLLLRPEVRRLDAAQHAERCLAQDLTLFTDMAPVARLDAVPEGVGGVLYHARFFSRAFVDHGHSSGGAAPAAAADDAAAAAADDTAGAATAAFARNDDLVFRAHTYRRGVPVVQEPVYFRDSCPERGLFFSYNVHEGFRFADYLARDAAIAAAAAPAAAAAATPAAAAGDRGR